MKKEVYPGVLDRMKAASVDAVVMFALMFMASQLFAYWEQVPDLVRIAAFITIVGLYDPLSTSFMGGTLGHHIFELRVRQENNEGKNILLPLAILRYVVKISLGFVSLLMVTTSEKKQALHDALVKSVVIYKPQKSRAA